jgi:hypoxanthine phosphoribosyltransferase
MGEYCFARPCLFFFLLESMMSFKYQELKNIAYQIIPQKAIEYRVNEIAHTLNEDSKEQISLFWIANGALAFVNLLWRRAGLFTRKELFIETIHARTYGDDLQPKAVRDDTELIDFSQHQGRRIILLDDRADSGATLKSIAATIRRNLPGENHLELVTLFQKKQVTGSDITLSCCGFTLTGNPWLIGVGLDHFSHYRTQPSLWMLKKEFLPENFPKEKRDIYPEHPSDVQIAVDGEPFDEWFKRAKEQHSGTGH